MIVGTARVRLVSRDKGFVAPYRKIMKSRISTILAGIVLSVGIAGAAAAQQPKEAPSYGPELEGFGRSRPEHDG